MAEINYPKLMAWMVIVLMPDMVEAGSAHRSGTKLESCPRDSAPGAWGALHAQPPAAYRLARMRNGVDANSRRPENHSKSPYFSGDYGPVRSLIFFFGFFVFKYKLPILNIFQYTFSKLRTCPYRDRFYRRFSNSYITLIQYRGGTSARR